MARTSLGITRASKKAARGVVITRPVRLLEPQWLAVLLLLFLCFCHSNAGDADSGRQDGMSKEHLRGVKKILLQIGADRALEETNTPVLAADGGLSQFPRVGNSTILFLHVFKCAGTSLREVFMAWARMKSWSGAVVEHCQHPHFNQLDKVCLNAGNDLVDFNQQKWLVAGTRVLAGHFFWDFRRYVTPPFLMVTTLRNPLELFVSSQQFSHRAETSTLPEAVEFVSGEMRKRIGMEQPQDLAFIRRLMNGRTDYSYEDGEPLPDEQLSAMTTSAAENLKTFYVVGVVEQYEGFIEVLKHALDQEQEEHSSLWKAALEVRKNGSPVHSSEVLRAIDRELVKEFNATTLSYQWKVYNVALELWDSRCRELLPPEDHQRLCSVLDRYNT